MKKYYFILLVLGAIFFAGSAFAKADLSINESDITFSNDAPLAGQTIRIYAKVSNTGDTDMSGFVVFYDAKNIIGEPQAVSVKAGSFDDVFIDWVTTKGKHNIQATLTKLTPKDESEENNLAIKKDFIVDIDTDKDGIPDLKDDDIDNDGLTNEEEKKLGTDPYKADTDGDGVNDKVDVFPFDKAEWRDANNNGIGDNLDPDADGDGITNTDETQKYGTNPYSADSDSDGAQDKKEIEQGTNPLKAEGIESPAKSILDTSRWGASLFSSIGDILKGDNKFMFIGMGVFAFIIMFFMFRKKKRR